MEKQNAKIDRRSRVGDDVEEDIVAQLTGADIGPVDAGQIDAVVAFSDQGTSRVSSKLASTKDGADFLRTPIHELRTQRGLSMSALASMVRIEPGAPGADRAKVELRRTNPS